MTIPQTITHEIPKLEVDILSRWFLIVNPTAGGGRALLDYPHISKLLHNEGIFCEPFFTEHKHQAVEYTVRAVKEGYRKIIVLGGDGTIHEVVNGLFIQKVVDPKEVTIGVIGVGRDDELLRPFGIDKGLYANSIAAIKAGQSSLKDVGVVSYVESQYRQERYMVGVGGTGFDANVVKRFHHRRLKPFYNRWSYMWCVVKGFFRYKSTGVKVYVDDELIYNDLLFSAAIGIRQYNKETVQQLPAAVDDDGLFDMTLIRPLYFWHILFRLKYLFDGNIYKIGHTEHWQGEKILIKSTPEMQVEVDGELYGGTPLEFTILKKAIRLIDRLDK